MRWDATRPVPWQQLVRSWLVYVAIMAVVFALFFRDDNLVGIFAGLLVSGPIYLGIGYLLAKLGYRRKTLKELRAERDQPARPQKSSQRGSDDVTTRQRPAPTKRTGGGTQRSSSHRKRRR